MTHSKGRGLELKFSVYYPELVHLTRKIECQEQSQATGMKGRYSKSIVGMFSAIRITGLSDVKAPKNTRDGDEERLLSDLLSRTNSSSPTERRVSRLSRVSKVLLQETIGVEGMRIGIIFGVMVDLTISRRPKRSERRGEVQPT
jgi:hypothetical protein